jgi:hypothetical protein
MKRLIRSIFISWEERFLSGSSSHSEFEQRMKYIREKREREYLNVYVH